MKRAFITGCQPTDVLESALVLDVLRCAQCKSGMKLRAQWEPLFVNMSDFLAQLGVDVASMQPSQLKMNCIGGIMKQLEYTCGPKFCILGENICAAMIQARRTHLSGEDVTLAHTEDRSLPWNVEHWPPGEYSRTQLMAVSGPVYVVADDAQESIEREDPIFCVSCTGINFAYNTEDRQRFSTDRLPNAAARERMSCIWHHALTLFEAAEVQYPVLCAIGCGAFANDSLVSTKHVVQMYADALASLLVHRSYGATTVYLSLVNPDHFEWFREVLEQYQKRMQPSVVLSADHGMVGLARELSRRGHRSGILNPSDPQALRQGAMGMYWYKGDIALEELLAVQTTLLLQHIDVNPAMWLSPSEPV